MKKSLLKRVSVLAVTAVMAFGMAACGSKSDGTKKDTTDDTKTEDTTKDGGDATETEAAGSAFTGEKYVNSGKDFGIKTADLPSDYVQIPFESFKTAFKAICDGSLTTYEDVAKAFGDDGIRMDGIVYEGYAYYGWYSDKDYTSDKKVYILVTFKVDGDKLTYYAYSSEGINSKDVA